MSSPCRFCGLQFELESRSERIRSLAEQSAGALDGVCAFCVPQALAQRRDPREPRKPTHSKSLQAAVDKFKASKG